MFLCKPRRMHHIQIGTYLGFKKSGRILFNNLPLVLVFSFLINYLLIIFFTLVFLHIKIPRIARQAKEVTVATSPTMDRGANPTYATLTPAIIVAAPANIPNPPIHLLRRVL